MIIDRFQQQPREIRIRQIDYTAFLNGVDTLSGSEAFEVETKRICGEAEDTDSPFTVSNVVIDVVANRLTYSATGGASGNQYQLTVLVNTENGQRHESEIIFTIKEI
jgi:hypothetical protein